MQRARMKYLVIAAILLKLWGIDSAPWQPACPHECWCREAPVSSSADDWKNGPSGAVRTVICVQQHDTDLDLLVPRLLPQAEALKIIQASDARTIHLRSKHFLPFGDHLRILSLEGVRSDNNLTMSLYADSLRSLPKLQYLSLQYVELLESPSLSSEMIEHPAGNVSHLIYLEPEEKAEQEILPYELFRKIQDRGVLWDGFTSMSNELESLRIIGCSLPDTFVASALAPLDHLEELSIRYSGLKVAPTGLHNKLLVSLSLADNMLLDVDLTGMEGLQSLDVSGNSLEAVTENALPLLDNLETLDLSRNPLRVVYSNAFAKVAESLRRLRMESATATELRRGCFENLGQLEELTIGKGELDDNGLDADYLKDLASLKELRMIDGKVTTIEADTFAPTRSLQSLILKRNQLRRLSVDAFQYLGSLRMLDLSGNELNHLPPGLFEPLRSLKELWLNDNKLSIVPADIFVPLSATTKLIRLNSNPWDCRTCQLGRIKETSVNKIKIDGVYQYDRRVAPLCFVPTAFRGVSVFDVIRRELRCDRVQNARLNANIWSEPTEAVDHGAEVDLASDPSLRALLKSSPSGLTEDEIDHDEQLDKENVPPAVKNKKENDVWIPESDNSPVTNSWADSSRMLKSAFFLSKKSQKFLQEEEKNRKMGKLSSSP